MIGGILLIVLIVLFSALVEKNIYAIIISVIGAVIAFCVWISNNNNANYGSYSPEYAAGRGVGTLVIVLVIGFILYCIFSK